MEAKSRGRKSSFITDIEKNYNELFGTSVELVTPRRLEREWEELCSQYPPDTAEQMILQGASFAQYALQFYCATPFDEDFKARILPVLKEHNVVSAADYNPGVGIAAGLCVKNGIGCAVFEDRGQLKEFSDYHRTIHKLPTHGILVDPVDAVFAIGSLEATQRPDLILDWIDDWLKPDGLLIYYPSTYFMTDPWGRNNTPNVKEMLEERGYILVVENIYKKTERNI